MKIGNLYDITFSTNRADTGALSSADSTPVVRVTENGSLLAYLPTVSTLSTGIYITTIDASLANGFEVGKRYSVYCTATVGGINGAMGIDSFTVENRSIDDVLPTTSYTTPPTAVAIRTEIDSNSTKLDVSVSTRLATASYTSPDNATISAIQTEVNSHPTLAEIEASTVLAKEATIPTV